MLKSLPFSPGRLARNSKGGSIVPLIIEVEREEDGRWLAEAPQLPSVLTYGQTRQVAIDRAQALSLRVLADRLDHAEAVPEMGGVFAVTP
jgi:predicted RNase H-like HicB family nuclease